MIKINVAHNMPIVSRYITGIGKQARFAAAVSLTRTAQDVQSEVPAALDRALDRPTEFTKRGTYIVPARKDRLESVIGFRTIQAKYMGLQISGGTVQAKAAGIKLPGNIQLNAYGNIPRGTIARLKAAAKGGALGPLAAKRLNVQGNRRKGAAPIQLFYGRPAGRRWETAPVGIWRRIPPAGRGTKGKLVPVILFEDTPARYRPRFDFASLANRIASTRFGSTFEVELRKALASAR